MPSSDLARRAVVTGLGAVMPIGNDFETYWRNLQNGVTGTRLITAFDASEFEVRIAAEVLDFDPNTVMDRKMAKRMSRSRKDAGIVELLHKAYNQRDEVVAECRRQAMMRKKPKA